MYISATASLSIPQSVDVYTASMSFTVVQLHSRVRLLATPRTAARQASLSFTISRSLLKFMSVELVMPSNHPILCPPLLLLPSIFSSIRVFSNKLAFCIRWPKYWSFSFSISPSSKYSNKISLGCKQIDLMMLLVHLNLRHCHLVVA